MGVHGCEGLSQGEIRRIEGQGEGQPPPQMLNIEPLEGLEKLQSRSVCRCCGLRLGRVRGVCECEGLPLKMSRRVGGQGWGQEARKRGKPPKTLTFEPLA